MQLPELAAVGVVACYIALPGEPDPAPLVTRLRARKICVAYPTLRADGDLDVLQPATDRTVAGRRGTREPAAGRPVDDKLLDLVVAPALAVDLHGHRLGRGGGAYDRLLSRVRPDALVVALVHDDEIVHEVPSEPHDMPVDVIVTEARIVRTGAVRASART